MQHPPRVWHVLDTRPLGRVRILGRAPLPLRAARAEPGLRWFLAVTTRLRLTLFYWPAPLLLFAQRVKGTRILRYAATIFRR